MEKADIRNIIRQLRSITSAEIGKEAEKLVFTKIQSSEVFKSSNRILLYHSLPDELPTIDTIAAWNGLKQIFLPRVNGVNLDIIPYKECNLKAGAYNIQEPMGTNTVLPDSIDLIIVPGMGFDRHGNRIGRGKGFYDRLLRKTVAAKIGICYDYQLLDSIPVDSLDVDMDYIVTPSCFIECKTS